MPHFSTRSSLRALCTVCALALCTLAPASPLRAEVKQSGTATDGPSAIVQAELEKLLELIGLEPLYDIMHDEGVAYAIDLEDEMFPGRGGDRWAATVEEIYRTDAMRDVMQSNMAIRLAPENVGPLITFFSSDLGQRIVTLEISARRARMDEAVEETSKEMVSVLRDENPGRFALLEEFIEVNDLLERNVSGALNSNFAFYLGMADGGAFPMELTEEQMLRDVWAQEPEIRTDSIEWLYSYLAMAYQPLSDDELRAYIELSETEAGRDLNAALFDSFAVLFNGISRQLGLFSAQFMAGEDI